MCCIGSLHLRPNGFNVDVQRGDNHAPGLHPAGGADLLPSPDVAEHRRPPDSPRRLGHHSQGDDSFDGHLNLAMNLVCDVDDNIMWTRPRLHGQCSNVRGNCFAGNVRL